MAPKRRKVVGSVVRTKTTSKVVKETVEVSLVETDNSEPQLTQEEENRETDEREEERAEIDLSVGKTPTRVIAVQGPEAKLKPEEQPPEKEPEYATPPEDVVEDQFPLMDEDHEDGEKETEKGEHEGREGKAAPEDQVQPEEQEEEEETQDIAQKEVEAAMDETGETPSEEEQGKAAPEDQVQPEEQEEEEETQNIAQREVEAAMDETGETPSEEEQGKPAPEDQVQPEEQEEEEETQNIAQREVEAAMDETGETPSEEEQGKQQEQEQVKQGEAASGKEEIKGKTRGRKRGRVKRMGMGEREGYKRYIHRVLKQVHPELGISSNAITVLDGFMKDMFQRLASEASNLSKYTDKMTVSSREVQAAVRLVLPGELGKHAVVEGTKAVSNYMSYDEGVAEKKKKA